MLGLNLPTLTRSPTVTGDEVMFVDPAVNFLMHGRFVTSAWHVQDDSQLFACNAPLYSLLQAGWMRITSIDVFWSRALNLPLIIAAAMVLAAAAWRNGWIRSSTSITLLIATIFGAASTTTGYRSNRYDALHLLLVALTLLLATLPGRRCLWAALPALLLAWAGPILPVFALLMCGLCVALGGRRAVVPAGVVAAGSVVGGLLFLGFLRYEGVLDIFFAFSRYVRENNYMAGRPLPRIGSALFYDNSSLLTFLAAVIIAIARRDDRQIMRLCAFAVAVQVIVTAVIAGLGHFPLYYCWMKLVPSLVLTLAAFERAFAQKSRPVAVAVILLLVAGCYALPARAMICIHEWRERDYRPLERFVADHVHGGDRVICDDAPYYPVKRLAADCIVSESMDNMPADRLGAINLVVINPPDAPPVLRRLGGTWRQTAEFGRARAAGSTLAMLYHAAVYERQPTP